MCSFALPDLFLFWSLPLGDDSGASRQFDAIVPCPATWMFSELRLPLSFVGQSSRRSWACDGRSP
jgi:hypothetical protein